MALSDTLAEIAALSQEQAQQPPVVPPAGTPGRPKVDLNPPAPKPSAVSKPGSLMDRIGTAIASVTDPIGRVGEKVAQVAPAAILRAPGQLVGGTIDSLADTDKWISDNIHPGFLRGASAPGMIMTAASLARQANRVMNGGASLADTLSQRSTLGQVGDPATNQNVTQTAAVGLSLLAPGAGEASIVPRVARLLASSAKVGAATALTADTAGSKTPLTDRIVQGAEGAAVNVVAEPLIGMLSSYIKAKPPTKIVEGSPEDALGERLDRGFASARTTEARFQAQEAQGKPADGADATKTADQAILQQGTRVSDADRGAADGVPGVGVRPAGRAVPAGDTPGASPGGAGEPAHLGYQDANSALKAAGAAESVDPATHPLTSDGKIPVEPATKAALDEAGLGRGFASTDEGIPKDSVIFKEEDPAGGSRVVGVIDKESLQGFKMDVEANRYDAENPADLTSDHPVGQWKLSNLGAPYDVQPFLRALADQLPERATLSDADVMAAAKHAADAIGWTHEDMIAYAASVAGDAKQLPQVMATVRTVYTRAASMVDSLLEEKTDWAALRDNHPKLQEALSAVHNMVTLGQSVAEFKSGVGGALRIAGLPDADAFMEAFGKTPAADLKPVNPLDGLPKLPRNQQELQQWLDVWDYTKGDPVARDAFIKGLTFMPGKWMQLRTSFANFFTAGIISGPATFMRDALGPAIIGGLRTLERTSGGYAAALMPWVDGAAKQDLLRSAAQAPMAYAQTLGAVADALKAAAKSVGQGHQLLQPHGLYDLRTRVIPNSLIEAATGSPPGLLNAGSYPYMLANVVNVFPSFIHALHGGVNEFAQRLSYLGEVRAGAMLEAAQQGLTGDDAAAHIHEALRNSTDEVTWAANNRDALASSQRTTLIKPVGGESQPIISKFSEFITTLRTNFPESRFILPIFTVPANAIGEGIRRIPIAGQLFAETRQELSGAFGTARQAEAYGRVLSGASLMTAGYAMARAGIITGPGPAHAQDRAVWEAQGMQPYSIRIGGNWVSYNRLDVVGNLLAIPAAIFDRSVHTQLDGQSAAFAGVAALAEYFKDQAALQGISELLSFGGSPQESEAFLARLGKQTVAGLVVPNFVTQLGRNNIDPDRRVARNPFEAVLDKLPGASLYLDPQRNALGEPTQKITNAAFGTLPISITTANSYQKDPVADELDRLYQVTGYAPGLKSPALPGGKEDMRDIKLEDGSSLYDALVRYRSQVTSDDGLKIRPALQALFDSPEYSAAVDGDAHNLKTANGDDDRGAMVAALMHKFDVEAQHQVAQASPIAARYLAVGLAKGGNNAFLRNAPAHDLVMNPKLLESLGINVQEFEDKVRGQ